MFHLIVNADKIKGEGKQKLDEVLAVFSRAGKECEVHETLRAGHAAEIAREITSKEDNQALIAMGGDGTLHEVLNGISDVEKCSLGLIPFGSGNDFAECVNLPFEPSAAAEIIAFRAPTGIDYIQLESGLRSINAVGMGIDVEVLKRAYSDKKRGRKKYFSAFIKSVFHYKPGTYKVVHDGTEEEHTGIICCLGNGRQIGGGIQLFPEADVRDGYIDLIMVDCLTKFRTLLAFAKLNSGKVNKVREVTHVKCKKVCVTPVGETQKTIQAEGEIYEDIPLEAHIEERKLSFYLPEND